MWINTMLSIWLWGTLFALVLIGFSLWKWYRPGPEEEGSAGDEDTSTSPSENQGPSRNSAPG